MVIYNTQSKNNMGFFDDVGLGDVADDFGDMMDNMNPLNSGAVRDVTGGFGQLEKGVGSGFNQFGKGVGGLANGVGSFLNSPMLLIGAAVVGVIVLKK